MLQGINVSGLHLLSTNHGSITCPLHHYSIHSQVASQSRTTALMQSTLNPPVSQMSGEGEIEQNVRRRNCISPDILKVHYIAFISIVCLNIKNVWRRFMTGEISKCPAMDSWFAGQNVRRSSKSFNILCHGVRNKITLGPDPWDPVVTFLVIKIKLCFL